MSQGLQPVRGRGWLWFVGLTLIGTGFILYLQKEFPHTTAIKGEEFKVERFQKDGQQCFKIFNLPPDSLVRIPQLVCSKGDTVQLFFTQGTFYLEGRVSDLKVSGSGEAKFPILIGNDGPGPRDSWVGIKSGKNPPGKIEGRIIRIKKDSESLREMSSKQLTSSTLRLRKIVGLAYSYSQNRWSGETLGGSYYPHVGVGFWSGLVGGSPIYWDGSHSFEGNRLCLTISNLKVPEMSPALEEYYLDFGVGYGVELDNAVFGDYTLARTPILFRTFQGDSPPKEIKKCFEIIPITETPEVSYRIAGEWEGEYYQKESNGLKKATRFVARIVQSGNKFNGSIIDFLDRVSDREEADKLRSQIEGWVLDGKVTFVKRNEKTLIGCSYVASFSSSSQELSGIWYGGLSQGEWYMQRKGDFVGSPDDIISTDVTNPPERKPK
jgi:hypothetical protein